MIVLPEKPLDEALAPICEKAAAGERLTHADGVTLFRTRDIFSLGRMANAVRERLHGRKAFYNVNRHINYTNYCVMRCKFCAFYRPYSAGGVGDGYEMSVEEVVETAGEAYDQGATEVHIVGGLHPKLPFEYYLEMCRGIRGRCPTMHIKAFTAIEIVHCSRIARPRLSVAETLRALREAGLDSLPGGGAEIFDKRVHDEAFHAKVDERQWFEVHRAAHDLGMPSNATMLYGHVETAEERVTHFIKLREHQDVSLAKASEGKAAFNCCVPLSFIPDGSELANLPGPTGLDDLRTLAVARLMLDNFPHIKAFWVMLSPKLAQTAMNWGADDFDGTVTWYDITKREGGGTTRQAMTVEQMTRLLREAGCMPVERDSVYNEITRTRA